MDDVLASKFALLRVRIESDLKLGSVILVTSAQRKDGKSLCAYGLAEGLVKVGHRAVLVDAAARRLPVADARPREAVPRGVPIVALSSDESALTTREAVYAFVAQMRGRYDYTIIDAAPLMSNSVAMSLASAVDAVLLAVRHGRPPSEDDNVMVQTLKHLKAKVLGVIASSPRAIGEFERSRASAHDGDSLAIDARVVDTAAPALLAQ